MENVIDRFEINLIQFNSIQFIFYCIRCDFDMKFFPLWTIQVSVEVNVSVQIKGLSSKMVYIFDEH